MAVDLSMKPEQSLGVKLPYTRKSHSKVRTGCRTCKIRRKKCDETRPACRRCTDSKRTCDGYASADPGVKIVAVGDTTFISSTVEALAVSTSPDERCMTKVTEYPLRSLGFSALGTGVSDLEYRCFSHFCHRTSPQFASYFECSIWRSYIICGALSHPALFATAVALGAVHRRFSCGISREAFEYCAHAAKLHEKAVRAVEQLKRQGKTQLFVGDDVGSISGCEVVVLCEILLGSFQVFQGEYDDSKKHFDSALKYLIRRPLTLEHSESQFCVTKRKPRIFCQLFYQLHGCAVDLFGSPSMLLVKWKTGQYLPHIPNAFSSLEEARDFLFTEFDWLMHAPARFSHSVHERSSAADMHIVRLQNWSLAYINMMRNVQRTLKQEKICLLLKTIRDATYLSVHAECFVDINMGLPKLPHLDCRISGDTSQIIDLLYISNTLSEAIERREMLCTVGLARVKELIRPILDSGGIFDLEVYDRSAYSPSIGLLYNQSRDFQQECSKNNNRDMRTTILMDMHTNSWEMLSIYGVAQRVSAIEEHATVQAVRSVMDDRIDLKWVDLVTAIENGEVMVRYYRPDTSGLGLSLVQEWWKF